MKQPENSYVLENFDEVGPVVEVKQKCSRDRYQQQIKIDEQSARFFVRQRNKFQQKLHDKRHYAVNKYQRVRKKHKDETFDYILVFYQKEEKAKTKD
jgi:hypothetical protein